MINPIIFDPNQVYFSTISSSVVINSGGAPPALQIGKKKKTFELAILERVGLER